MGISTYDPFNNFEYIFASPTDSSNFTKDGRLFQVEYNTREFNLIPLRSSGVAFTTIEFDPESLSLLGTYTNVGKPSHFGQINISTGLVTSYGQIQNYDVKIGVSAFDSYRFAYYLCAKKRGVFSGEDVLLKINLVSGDDKTYKIRKISPLVADSLPSLEIVQIDINTKYNNVNVLQAVALNLIFADKTSDKGLGWKKMMLDFGDEEFPSTTEQGSLVTQSGPIRREKGLSLMKEIEKLFSGNNSRSSVNILSHFVISDSVILSTGDYNMTEPIPVNSGISLFVKSDSHLESFLSADSLGPSIAPEFSPGYPKFIGVTNTGYKMEFMTNQISVVSMVAVNVDELRNIRNASGGDEVQPYEENVVIMAQTPVSTSNSVDGIRSGAEILITRPSDEVSVTIENVPCNTDIQVYYISRYGRKANSGVRRLELPNNLDLPRLGCAKGYYCPNTALVVNQQCKPCLAGSYQNVDNGYVCETCKPGFFQPNQGQSKCNACPAGTESGKSTVKCNLCPLGFYAPCSNTTNCLKCPIGQTTWEVGSIRCVTERIFLPPPTDIYVEGINTSTLCVNWKRTDEDGLPSGVQNITQFVIAYGFTSQVTLVQADYTAYATCTTQNCSYCFKPEQPIYNQVLFFRVAGRVAGVGIGAASATSASWTISSDCGNNRYLDDGDKLLSKWTCRECPHGGDCTGSVLWNDVRAKFGYYRLDDIDRQSTNEFFWPCVNPVACLGGRNTLLADKFFDEEGNDLALMDLPEACNYELGFETNCKMHDNNESSTSHCRLCHACRPGYMKGGIGECIQCPPEWADPILVGLAIVFVILIVYSFFQTALEQFQEDDIHSHHHYGQTLKKIVINHLQLLGIAAGFPLRWPRSMSNYFRFLNGIGSASEYFLNPSCRSSATPQASTFFLDKAIVLLLPVICFFVCGIFWSLVGLNSMFRANQANQRKRRAQARLAKRGFILGLDKNNTRKLQRQKNRAELLQVKSAWEKKTAALPSVDGGASTPITSKDRMHSMLSPTSVVPVSSSSFKTQKRLASSVISHKRSFKVSIIDKFITTMVAIMYLLYPVLCKATLTMNSCVSIGDKKYLVMDMSIQCNNEEHMGWIYNAWLPSIIVYVIGLPLVAWLQLYKYKGLMNKPTFIFKFGLLFSGYRRSKYYWESIIALRKASIAASSLVFATLGAEAQALLAILITLLFALLHLQKQPFVKVVSIYDSLSAAESWALIIAILTLWSGLFYFQDIAASGTLPIVLTFIMLCINVIYFIIVIRWALIFRLMDLHSQRRHLPVGKQRKGLGGIVMVVLEIIVPSWVSRTQAKWRHAVSKLRVGVRFILLLRKIRRRNEAERNAVIRKKHLQHRNMRKNDLLPHRSRISNVRSRMRKIELLKSKLLPLVKDSKTRTRPSLVVPRRQAGRYTPTRIYPLGIPSPSIGRRTPTPSRRSRISPAPSQSGSRSRLRSSTPKSSSLRKISPSGNILAKNRRDQAQIMQDIAVKRLAERKRAIEARERKLEEMKNDPMFVHKQNVRKLKAAIDTQQFAKHGLRRMLESEVKRLAAEKSKLRGQIEKLMKLGRAKKLSKTQVDKLKETMKLLRGKYEAIIKREKAVQTRLKHV